MLIKQPIHLTLAEDKFSFTISQAANSLYLKLLNKVFMGFRSFQLLSGLRIVCPNPNSLGTNIALSSLTSPAASINHSKPSPPVSLDLSAISIGLLCLMEMLLSPLSITG